MTENQIFYDFELINCKNKLFHYKVKKFISLVKSQIIVQIISNSKVTFEKIYDETTIKNFFHLGFKLKDEDLIYFIGDDSTCVFSGEEYNCWVKIRYFD